MVKEKEGEGRQWKKDRRVWLRELGGSLNSMAGCGPCEAVKIMQANSSCVV